MRNPLKHVACLLLLTAPSFLLAAELETLVYPTKDNPSFTLRVPSDWELTAAEEEGDYFHIEGPSGAIFSFRTLEGNEEALTQSIKNCIESMHEKFDAVELGEATDWSPSGLTGFYAIGTAKEKKSGNPIRIALAWCALPNEEIAEAWFVTDLADEKGMDRASEILNSLKAQSEPIQ